MSDPDQPADEEVIIAGDLTSPEAVAARKAKVDRQNLMIFGGIALVSVLLLPLVVAQERNEEVAKACRSAQSALRQCGKQLGGNFSSTAAAIRCDGGATASQFKCMAELWRDCRGTDLDETSVVVVAMELCANK